MGQQVPGGYVNETAEQQAAYATYQQAWANHEAAKADYAATPSPDTAAAEERADDAEWDAHGAWQVTNPAVR